MACAPGIGVTMARRPVKGRLVAVDGAQADTVKGTARTVSTECRPRAAVSHEGASGIFDDIAAGDPGAGRPSARTLLLLYAADLAFRLRWEIGPALEEGRSVVVAPYVDTAIAVGRAAGLPRSWLVDLFAFAPKPSERRVVTLRADEISPGRARGFVDLACRSMAGSATPDEFARTVGRHLTPRRR